MKGSTRPALHHTMVTYWGETGSSCTYPDCPFQTKEGDRCRLTTVPRREEDNFCMIGVTMMDQPQALLEQ